MLLNITNSYPVLIVFCIGLGLADGCFWVVEGPIAYDICGPSGAAQAIGFLKGLMGISFAAGPPIAGNLLRRISPAKKASFIALSYLHGDMSTLMYLIL